MDENTALPADELRWRIDESTLPFGSTAEVDPAEGVVGQPIAMEAMRFGVETSAPGQNIYVRGTSGTGRTSLVQSLLRDLKPRARRRLDRCYVHNFFKPDQPRLITLPAGDGPELRRRMKELADYVDKGLAESLEAEPLRSRREALVKENQQRVMEITQPLEKNLAANGLTLARIQTGPVSQTVIFPVIDDKPVPPDELSKMASEGKVSKEQLEAIGNKIGEFSEELQEVSQAANKAWQAGIEQVRDLVQKEVRRMLMNYAGQLLGGMIEQADVAEFLHEVIEDIIENRLSAEAAEGHPPPQVIYGVNVISSPDSENGPVITENSPTVTNLLGSVEPEYLGGGQAVSNYRGVRAGSLIRADGGFLILDAYDVLSEPGAWRLLMRVLRTGCVEIIPREFGFPTMSATLKPEPVPVSVRVILIGGSTLYYQLDQVDQDFSNLFKVLADFKPEMDRTPESINQYAAVVAHICEDEGLVHFSASGVAALAEHGARIAARRGKLTARFGRVADIAREAAFLAGSESAELADRRHVEDAVRRTKYRASLPSERFQELISDGTIGVRVSGSEVGQINGLAVMNAGPLTYGFPSRITTSVGAGRAGIINIEGAADMSGAIHTKGFHILGGLLRRLLDTDHPLTFSASIAFEQSYGGIDGDSASGAEICCLLSALTGVPIKQSLAMTGAIDQIGHIQAIGGVNEKIEGFFDACAAIGLNGEQGVIVPVSNAGDLMLRADVVEACREGRFAVYAVSHVGQALAILTGLPSGLVPGEAEGETTVLELARQKAGEYWRKSFNRPEQPD